MKKRIIGIDVARALAVIGMIIVNFKVVFGAEGADWLKRFAGVFDGKAAATFVVLAGVGLALMTNAALQKGDEEKLNRARRRITKRALFLFVIGLSYIVIWPADILHFYGIYMLVVLLLLRSNQKVILITAIGLILLYPLLMGIWTYETGWDFSTLDYLDFWTIKGFLRNLFFNGFHPVIPWTSFMLFGYWFGKQDLRSDTFIKKALWVSSIAFVLIQLLSYVAIMGLSEGNEQLRGELSEILGVSPMPPLPVYMFNGITVSVAIISACILIGRKFPANRLVLVLNKTGQLALTFYVAHVIIGMGLIEMVDSAKMGTYSIVFSLSYALCFSLLCMLFAVFWSKHKKAGPLEWIMRKITD